MKRSRSSVRRVAKWMIRRARVNTVVRWSMVAPAVSSSGAMNRLEPNMRPIVFVKGPRW